MNPTLQILFSNFYNSSHGHGASGLASPNHHGAAAGRRWQDGGQVQEGLRPGDSGLKQLAKEDCGLKRWADGMDHFENFAP